MVRVYAIVLAIGVVLLIAWIFLRYFVGNTSGPAGFDPEARFGRRGRQVVAAMVGFGMAGMSAEFSPRDLSWPVALVLALAGAIAAAWFAGFVDRLGSRPGPDNR
ncbi:MAG TPA: hypothetical protein VIA81_04530 [Acidimicrobiia bacterium]|jgi:hypothetical protein